MPINYSELLKDRHFQMALFLASRRFFNELQKSQFNYALLTDKQKHSVKRYANRTIYRSTPFGLFSSFSLIDCQNCAETSDIILGHPAIDIKPDFVALQQLWEFFLKSEKTSFSFKANQSFQFNQIDYRYIKKNIAAENVSFSMVSMEKNSIVKKVLKFCQNSQRYKHILDFLVSEYSIDIDEANMFLDQLIREQVLVATNAPTITGRDYSDLLCEYVNAYNGTGQIETLKKCTSALTSVTLNNLQTRAEMLDSFFRDTGGTSDYFYAVSKRTLCGGTLPLKYLEMITEGLECLNIMSTATPVPDLQKFKDAFMAKYESGEMPLLEALDSQFGIGYSDLDEIKVNYGLSSTSRNSQQFNFEENHNEIASLLINQWQLNKGFDHSHQLQITDEHLNNLRHQTTTGKLPPSLSVIFRTLDDAVFIESAGGVSALSLVGRFAFCKEAYKLANAIAQQEQASNKDIIFVEIAHCCNLHTANISRRPHLYDYEIPVVINSALPAERQIPLQDIMVSVTNNTVVLRSKKLNKRIIPRLSSAVNYTKSSFPVFRFLCDVQNQEVKANFGFSVSAWVPGLSFYPRVCYKSCILQLAEWHLGKKDFSHVDRKSAGEAFAQFQQLRKNICLPRYFTYNVSDNFLLFDSDAQEDVLFFLKEISGKEKITLREFPFLQSKPLVKNELGQALVPQFIASLCLKERTYEGTKEAKIPLEKYKTKKDTKDWIYFKIYCHPLSSDRVLTSSILPAIKKLIQNKTITGQWFWIRYKDPQYHLRLRLNVCRNNRPVVLDTLTTKLDELRRKGLVSSFQNDIYHREIERYSCELIDKVESFFMASSQFIARWLRSKDGLSYEDDRALIEAATSAFVIMDSFQIKGREQIEFCKLQFDNFFLEFGKPHSLKPQLEKLYRKNNIELGMGLQRDSLRKYKDISIAAKCVVNEHKSNRLKFPILSKLAADFVHMHLNRLFVYDQRYFEMVTYFLLYRSLNSQLHKQ